MRPAGDLLDHLTEYCGKDVYPFHMPGHKRNPGSIPQEDLYRMDITEISGFDDLHHASGILKEAEERASNAYGSSETHFLVNGSTAGILAAVSALTQRVNPSTDGGRSENCPKNGKKPKDPVLIAARNCHKSVYHAAIMNRLGLRYLLPEYDTEYNIAGPVRPEAVEKALKDAVSDNDRVVGVLITSPTYEGITSDIGVISELTHAYGLPLIVDEAHGAHFGFAEGFPENAVRLGADLVIHSAHKTLPAPTQTALIHINGDRIDRELLRKYLRIFQTSSPSYPLMAYLDRAVGTVSSPDYEGFAAVKRFRSLIESRIADCSRITMCPYTEPSKLLFRISPGTALGGEPFTGKELFDRMRDQYRIEFEMSSPGSVLGILTGSDTEEGIKRLIRALTEIDAELSAGASGNGAPVKEQTLPEQVLPLYEAFCGPFVRVPLEEASGRIAADLVFPYPPGIPIAAPGERISEEMIREITALSEAGYDIRGLEDGGLFILQEEK